MKLEKAREQADVGCTAITHSALRAYVLGCILGMVWKPRYSSLTQPHYNTSHAESVTSSKALRIILDPIRDPFGLAQCRTGCVRTKNEDANCDCDKIEDAQLMTVATMHLYIRPNQFVALTLPSDQTKIVKLVPNSYASAPHLSPKHTSLGADHSERYH